MKRLLLILILTIFIVGCGQMNLPKFQGSQKQISTGRGIQMSFLPNMPPTQIRGPFRLGLEFTNHNIQPIAGTLTIRDVTPYSGFESETRSLQIPGALVEYSEPDPQTQIARIIRATPSKEMVDFGKVEYPEVEEGSTTQFIADFEFNHISNLNTQFCVGRAGARKVTCPEQESFSGQQLGRENEFSPITTSVRKIATSATPGESLVQLEINLRDVGDGEIKPSEFLIAQIDTIGEGLTLECNSLEAVSGTQDTFEIKLDNKKATITCFGDASFAGDLEVYNLFVSLSYPYRLNTNTGSIKILTGARQTL